MPIEVTSQTNFLRGLSLVTGKTTVIPGSVVRNSNMFYQRRGSLTTTDGTRLYTTFRDTWGSPPLSSTAPTESYFQWVGTVPNGPSVMPGAITSGLIVPNVVFSGSSPYGFGRHFYDISTNPATLRVDAPLEQSATTQLPMQLVGANNFTVFLMGNTVKPTFYDFYNRQPLPGNQFLGAGAINGAAHGVFHGGQVWIWNTYPQKNQDDGPSVLRACAFLADGTPDLTNFPTNFIALIDANDGTEGTGIISYTSSEQGIAPTPTLVLFKNYKTFQVTGKFGDGSIAVTRAQTEMGCVAPRTIQFVPGFGIVRMTHFGVAVFDGLNDTLISEEIRPYLFGGLDDIAPLNWADSYGCVSALSSSPAAYLMAVPVVSTGDSRVPFTPLTRVFCYDLVLKAWNVADFPTPMTATFSGISYIASILMPGTQPFVLLGDSPINTAGPSFTATGFTTGGHLASGNYLIVLTGTGPNGETGPSTAVEITIPPAVTVGQITITSVTLPAGSTGYRAYVGYFPGDITLNAENKYEAVSGSANSAIVQMSSLMDGTPPASIGGLRRFLGGDDDWDGTPIQWKFRLPDVFGKSPSSRVFFRRSVLRGKFQDTKITGKFTVSGVEKDITNTREYAPLVPGAIYGKSKYGFAKYSDAYPDLVQQFDVGITGASANAEYSGQGRAEILANDWHFTPRPEGGASRVS